jgi:Dictyostelium (slime mold) repeat
LAACTTQRKCGECVVRDCDKDSECNTGLLCADAHKTELTALGLDPRKAYCGNLGARNWELCYDPKKVVATCKNDGDCSDGDVCNGLERCDPAGSCVIGPPLDCNDNNQCTVDTCDKVNGCIHTPKTCGESEICDAIDGLCKDRELARPCISVIDESDNFSDADINLKWATFRANFPDRPFCLLQPLNPSYSRIFKPTNPDFLTDPRVVFAVVNRDNGDPNLASDWLGACGYSTLAINGVDFIGLFVDESGSMTRATVQASLDKLDLDLAAASLTYCSVFNGSEDWITPFDTLLGTVGGGGACSAPVP